MENMQERSIVLCPNGEVDGQVTKEFMETLAILDMEDGPIKVIICSDGGWFSGGVAIYEAIRGSRNFITTQGLGTVGSIAVLILQAGDKRLIGEHTTVFLHETSIHFEGGVTSAKSMVDETERLHKVYCNILSNRSGAHVLNIQQLCKTETYLTAKEALALGLVDGVQVDAVKPPAKKKGK